MTKYRVDHIIAASTVSATPRQPRN